MKKLGVLAVLMVLGGTAFGAMSDWKTYEKTANRMPWKLLKAESDYAVLASKMKEVQSRWAAATNDMTAAEVAKVAGEYDQLLGLYEGALASKTEITNRFVATSNAGLSFSKAALATLAFRDAAYYNAFLAANVNALGDLDMSLPTVEVTNLATAKLAARQVFAGLVVCRHRAPVESMIQVARRIEMQERRAAGLTVVGPTALPKTAALTEAFNSGTGLVAALSALGLDITNLADLVAAKVALAKAKKSQIDGGVVDPVPTDVNLLSTWLGARPVADWVKQYNAQK